MSERIIITDSDYRALREVWKYSPTSIHGLTGVSFDTLFLLERRGLLESELKESVTYYWLTESGKRALDEYPHRERLSNHQPPAQG